jgi:hypothetical protein
MSAHIGKPMALAFISLGVCSAALTAQKPAQQLDLKGETLGESLEAFKKAHPGARCWKTEPEPVGEDTCVVHRGISFAALPAVVDEDCDQIEAHAAIFWYRFKLGDGHNCWEGLSADFRSGKLIRLAYSVEAEGGPEFALNQVLSALREKFGNPDFGEYGSDDVRNGAGLKQWLDPGNGGVVSLPNLRGKRWSNGNEVLIVMPAHELPVGQGKPKANVISVTLGTIENNAKKDI